MTRGLDTAVVEKNEHGFELIKFLDDNGIECSLQQSGAIGYYDDAYARLGTSKVWLGVGNHRMHLDRDRVVSLVDRLNRWLTTGSFQATQPEPSGIKP